MYEDVSPTGPYAHHTGNFTAYGDVLPLLGEADDRFVIIASGDEVALEFDPSSLPPVRPGWSRDYFLYADGFAKDMDFYESLSDTVEPLPFHSMPRYPYGSGAHYPTSLGIPALSLDLQHAIHQRRRRSVLPREDTCRHDEPLNGFLGNNLTGI